MEIEIDSINVTVAGEDWEEETITREVELYLSRALEMLSKDDLLMGVGEGNIEALDLPEIDWEAETDKTGKLIQLLKNALEDYGS